MFASVRFLLRLTRAHKIARRYFVTNGFDGALAMLGLTMGFLTGAATSNSVVVSACLGTAIALAVSGWVSAYVSEAAERARELRELEQALVANLDASAHGRAARWVPVYVGAINGSAPLLVALVVLAPLWFASAGVTLPCAPLQCAVGMAFLVLFLLGVFLGRVTGRFWLWSGLRTLLVGLVTAGVIALINA
jgi:predicted membrane protein (TIGR00267 family)